ncbi:MAG: methyltransferase domain-containing protein [Acidimicrobiia bacterium]|nr:methyltransferase domain-containing protein [Acidimicrobiia bacterium]
MSEDEACPAAAPPSPASAVRGSTGGSRWFEAVAEHLGAAYLRYSFTYGTEQEVDFLVEALGLEPGSRVLDVGCGPGRHARAFAGRGFEVLGLDISARFLAVARAAGGAAYVRADAACLPVRPASVDVVVSLCQGGFGLMAGPTPAPGTSPLGADLDGAVLEQMAAVLRPGGLMAVTAFSSYFQVRFLEAVDEFDADRGVNHERTEVRSEAGETAEAELWTSCFTPRELRLLARAAGVEVVGLWSVTPGGYARRPADLEHPELLLVARRPRGRTGVAPAAGARRVGC